MIKDSICFQKFSDLSTIFGYLKDYQSLGHLVISRVICRPLSSNHRLCAKRWSQTLIESLVSQRLQRHIQRISYVDADLRPESLMLTDIMDFGSVRRCIHVIHDHTLGTGKTRRPRLVRDCRSLTIRPTPTYPKETLRPSLPAEIQQPLTPL